MFASEGEALSRAKSVYEQYLKIGEQVSERGGEGVESFQSILTGAALIDERKGAAQLRERNLTSVGAIKLKAFKLQNADLSIGRVATYACVDLTDVRVKDAKGRDVTPTSRPNLQTLRPSFVWQSGHLVLEENGTWSGSSIC